MSHEAQHAYRAPRCKIGGWLTCRFRGRVKVVAISDTPVPWPMTRRMEGGAPFLIVCGDLVRAIQRESASAVMHLWGVGSNTVWTWRKALGVEQNNAGTLALRRESAPRDPGMAAKMLADPERAAKSAATRKGKPRPPGLMAKLHAGNVGRKHSDETRRKMSEAHKGRMPPAASGPAWTAEELALLGTMPDAEVAKRIGRSYQAVWQRREKLWK